MLDYAVVAPRDPNGDVRHDLRDTRPAFGASHLLDGADDVGGEGFVEKQIRVAGRGHER